MYLALLRLDCMYLEHSGRDFLQQFGADRSGYASRIHSRIEFDDVRAGDFGLDPLNYIQRLAG